MTKSDQADAANLFEVTAVIATGLLHFAAKSTGFAGVFIAAVCVFWLGYVVYRVRSSPGALRRWGFRSDNLGRAFVVPTVAALVVAPAMAAFAVANGRFRFPAHTAVLLAVYPLWGVVQQFLVQGLVVSNLERLPRLKARWPMVLVGAGLFGLVHFPYPALMGATFGLGLLFTPLYLRDRNLWPLGLYHGLLGTLFYLWVLGRDPWQEVIGGVPM